MAEVSAPTAPELGDRLPYFFGLSMLSAHPVLVIIVRRAFFSVIFLLLLPLWLNGMAHAGELKKLEQPRFTLIFPVGLEAEATRTAHLLNDYLDQHLQQLPLSVPLRKIPILLTPSAHSSNGYVGLMPYRSRWFNKPAPFAGLEWLQALSVHESRHIVQFNQLFDHCSGRWLELAFGELGIAIMLGGMLPNWYMEGDAVFAETEFTDAGRGRVAAFDLWLRADLLSFTDQRYEQTMLGSGFERYPYPNDYVLGYHLIRYFRQHYDAQLFDRVLARMATFSALTFDGAVYDETGQTLRQHFQNMVAEFRAQWQRHLDSANTLPTIPMGTRQQDHWRSLYPLSVDGEEIIALRVDVEDGAALVSRNKNESERLLTRVANNVTGSYLGGSKTRNLFPMDERWCWLAGQEHPSKTLHQGMTLWCWGEQQGTQALFSQSDLTAAAYQQGRFLWHEFNEVRESRLSLRAKDGRLLQEYVLPEQSMVWDLQPTTDGGWLMVLQQQNQQTLVYMDAQLTQRTALYAAQQEFLRSPVQTKHWLLYISDLSGVDQLYALHRKTGERFLLTQADFGNYYPVWDDKNQRIILADYQPSGQRLVSVPFTDSPEAPLSWLAQARWPDTLRQSSAGLTTSAENPDVADMPMAELSWRETLPKLHSRYLLYDGNALSLTLLADDLFGRIGSDLVVGWQPQAQDWFADARLRGKANGGAEFGVAVAKVRDAQLGAFAQFSGVVKQSWQAEQGRWHGVMTPGVGAVHLQSLNGAGSLSLYQALLEFEVRNEQPIQAITPRFHWQQAVLGQTQFPGAAGLVYSKSQLSMRALGARQALSGTAEWQYMPVPTLNAMQPTVVYPEAIDAGLAGRVQGRYHWNLGEAGKAFGRGIYWRNTELAFRLQGQYQQANWLPALGLTLSPNLNLLRNRNAVVALGLSVDYRLDSQQWRAYMGARLGF